MTCTSCREIEKVDGEKPRCETGEGCLIPDLSPDALRIWEIRDRLLSLRDLLGAGPVLQAYGVTLDDLELLADLENALKAMDEEDKGG